MKRCRMFALLTVMLLLLSQTMGVAANSNISGTGYDPRTMTFEERAEWVEENVEPVYSGQAHSLMRGEWLYTNTQEDEVGNDMYDVGQLQTAVKFLCNSDFTEVEDYATVTFRAIPLKADIIVDTDYFADYFAPNNVRIIYTAWFADLSGAYYIEHWYNLHGDGAYDVRVVTGGPWV